MIGNIYHPRFFILTIVLMCLLFFPMINCTKIQLKESEIENDIRRLPMRKKFYSLVNDEDLNLNSEEEEQMKFFLENYLKTNQHRRALAFHAMRGKRSVKIT